MLLLLKNWYNRQQFDPGIAGWAVNPFFLARRGLMQKLRPLLVELQGDVLDVGCGRKPYRTLVASTSYVGLDFDSPVTRAHGVADVYYAGGGFPFDAACFDGVLCTQVFEHVFTPREFLGEIHRTMRPGGTLVLTVPFVWDEHEQPYDFGRYSSFGLRASLESAGFEVISLEKSCADGRALAQLAAGFLFKICRTKNRMLNLLCQILLIAPSTLLGWALSVLLPCNPDLYLDNVAFARKRI